MKFIAKQKLIPEQFTELIKDVAGYEGVYNDIKTQLLAILIQEQNGLCAYCNQKIIPRQATVEHLVCQSHNSNLALNYFNLYAVCKGSDGYGIERSHCDKYRANGAENNYFFPFILFEHCKTASWDNINPFFDAECNPRTGIYSGKIKARQKRINGYPSIENTVLQAISVLNLNSETLVEARKERWEQILQEQAATQNTWQALFDHYLHLNPHTNFHEFVLLSIRKQVI